MGNVTDNFSTKLESANIDNQPYLFEYTFTFSVAEIGSNIRFKLEAENERGATLSQSFLTVLMAKNPD